jgi:DNA invertase Pin-like site-specific DNA recombinase
MKIDYARVSTEDQSPDLQLAALKKVGCKRTFIEKATVEWNNPPKARQGIPLSRSLTG